MYRFTVKGIVQGVGFRPYVYNASQKAGLVGFVQNVGTGVIIETNNKEVMEKILKTPPPLARIDSVVIETSYNTYNDFQIYESLGSGFAEIPPDLFLCADCHQELLNKKDRRYKYFFTTCTNCGPRFTMTKHSPYDRNTTTMDEFPMCEQCQTEYTDPANRRYHAQTIACHDCGPQLELTNSNLTGQEAIEKTAQLIKNDEIVAIKGIGGFHLACNTRSETIKKLKQITGREHKPFSLMCQDTAMAENFCIISEPEKKLLNSIERPIVVLKKKDSKYNNISELDTLGIMLPYTALHYLLFEYLKEPIVMTSSNLSGEPITTEAGQQFVNHVLDHNRKIENSADDSLVKVINNNQLFLRRSRGFIPQSIPVKTNIKQNILAVGAELNNAFAVYSNGRITPSQYIGNTSNIEVMNHYKEMVNKFLEFTDTKPDIVLSDLHPQYNTTLFAQEFSRQIGIPLQQVQHHLAHAYSVASEHELSDFVAITADGLGYGSDGNIWGGEVLNNNERIGHLEEQFQLGGDSAARYPHKMLFGILKNFLGLNEIEKIIGDKYSGKEYQILNQQYENQINSPITTSCGRILDAATALLDLCDERTYDGRPAMLLEAHSSESFGFAPIIKDNVLLTTPLFEYLVNNLNKDKARLAATVQQYLAEGFYQIAQQYNKPIVFSGGCAYNRIMTTYLTNQSVLLNKKIPAGDGGISFGQIAYYLANPGHDVARRHAK